VNLSICSYSFHRLLAAGEQDVFQYIKTCRQLGCTHLDPWNAHLALVRDNDDKIAAGSDPAEAGELSAEEVEYLDRVKAAAEKEGMPFDCIAADGGHLYADDPANRQRQRAIAYRWIEAAARLGARHVRIDAGGPEEMPDEAFRVIVDGYKDVIERAKQSGVVVLTENHWGPTRQPDNTVKLLETVQGLGLLFDTNNWARGKQGEGWLRCAKYARATHFKTFYFAPDGTELTVNLANAVQLLKQHGYEGCWGIESVPREIDEIAGVEKTIALLRKLV
jgi:sugar phosphate isomerase/epimerase